MSNMLPQSPLDNIRIVLVNPTHPGNIGAAARAMKTMGVSQLYLVTPQRYPDAQAVERAAHAVDILEKAHVVASLPEALQGCNLVYGTSARSRSLSWPLQDVRPAATQAVVEATHHQIAFIFGREHSGLTNEELALCQYQIQIPANPDYSSLNLASAVQIICYELRTACLTEERTQPTELPDWATLEEIELFYQHFERALTTLGIVRPEESNRQIIARLRRLFSRTRLNKTEINILRGILKTAERQAKPS